MKITLPVELLVKQLGLNDGGLDMNEVLSGYKGWTNKATHDAAMSFHYDEETSGHVRSTPLTDEEFKRYILSRYPHVDDPTVNWSEINEGFKRIRERY